MTYEIRSFDAAGVQSEIIPGGKVDVTDELFTNGYVKITIPRNALGASRLRKRLEVALFLDGVEVDNTRALLVEHTGNPASSEDAAGAGDDVLYGGKTMFGLLRGAVVYPSNWPNSVLPPYHDFNNTTPGVMLKTLLQKAQQRGALPWLDHSTWTTVRDSRNAAWSKTVSLRYTPGVTYASIIENLVRLGACEPRMNGRTLSMYNPDTVGTDRTVGNSPVILRRGRDVVDTPYSETTDELSNVLLVTGDAPDTGAAPIIFERVDQNSVTQFGRWESSLSQGGTQDLGTLATLADASLDRYSTERGSYSVKFTPDTVGPQPFRDFGTGDWVFLDKSGTLEKYRVRQLSITTDDDGYEAVATLNDTFAELDMRTAKKVEGILGGAGADTVQPAKPDQTDRTIPKPPTGLNVITNLYTDPSNGARRGNATSNWLPPTQNTDNTAIGDLSHYEIEHQTDGQVTWDQPAALGPMRPAPDLSARFDRRGRTNPGWVGADGGGNWSADSGEVFHAWGDSLWGTITSAGERKATMPRNTMTSFNPAVRGELISYGGVENLVPLAAAQGDTTGAWSGLSNATASVVTSWAAAYSGKCVQLTATAAGVVACATSVTRTTSQNNTYKPIRAGKTYRVMLTFDTADTTTSERVLVAWINDVGATISTSTVTATSSVVDSLITAPAGAVTATFTVNATAAAAGNVARFTMPAVFETTHQMQNWRLPAQTVTVTNEITNPDGARYSTTTQTRRNFVTNPALYNDTTGFVVHGGAALVRDTRYVHGQSDGVAGLDVVNPAALTKWNTARAAAGTAQANIVVTGTSVSSGLSSSTFLNRYQTRLQDMLRASVPVTGVKTGKSGYAGLQGFVPFWYQSDPNAPSLPGLDGQKVGGQNINSDGLGGQAGVLSPGDMRRFKATFTNLRVHYSADNTGGGDLLIVVDGREFTINTLDAAATRDPRVYDVPVTFASAEHVVELRNPAPPGVWSSVIVGGVEVFDGDKGKGVHVYDGAHSGWAAKSNVDYPNVAKSVARVAPHLVTIELGYNDAGGGRSSDQVKSDIATFISQVQTACTAMSLPTPSFLIVGGYDPGSALYGNPNNAPGSWPEPWPNYLAKMRTLATGDVAYVDLSTVMPRISDDTTGLYDGVVHPSDKGHAMIANLLHPVLNPAVTAGKRASLRVSTVANAASSGAGIGYAPAADWPVGASWTYTAWLRGPAGAKLGFYSGNAAASTSQTVTLTGDWQRVTQSGTIAAGSTTGPQFVVRTPDTTQAAFTFYVGDVQLEKSATASMYFDGESGTTGDEVTAWAGTRYASQSTAGVPVPTGWTVSGGTIARSLTVTRPNANATSVRLTGAGAYAYCAITAPSSAPVTGIAWVMSPTGGTAYLRVQNSSTVLVSGATVTLKPGEWTQVRVEGVPASAANLLLVNSSSADYYVSELTFVLREWPGSGFTGASRNTEGITCSWVGAANASKSTAVWRNSNYIDVGYNFFGQISTADSVTQLINTTPLPAGHVGEWCWPGDGCYTNSNRAIVVHEAVMSDASIRSGWNFGFTGSFFLIEYDLAAKKITRQRRFARDPRGGKQCISWGGATLNDLGYVYIFGSRGNTAGGTDNYVVRAAAASAFDGPYQVWTSTGWVTASAGADMGRLEIDAALPTPAVIFNSPDAGLSSVRKFRGKFKAYALGGFAKTLDLYTADNPQGPWSKESSVYTFPDPAIMYYSAKFQTGTDDNSTGYGTLFSQTSGENILNPGLYIPAWVRGPAGPITAGAGGTTWKDRQTVDSPPAAYGNLNPGSVYSSRVRAVDQSGNASDWAASQPVIIDADTAGPNKPSPPLVFPFFQGARVLWDGLDSDGVGMPGDFKFYEVHMSEHESFATTPATLVDKVATAGGVANIQDLAWGHTYWFRLVAVDTAGNRSPDSDAVSATPERLSDPDLPDKLITGAKIADGAINTEKLTVAAFGENLIPGGNMEDARADGTVVGWRGFFTNDPVQDKTSPVAGASSMRIDNPGNTGMVIRTDQAIPITPGDVYYVSAKIKTSRNLDAPSVGLYLAVADTADKAGSGFGQDVVLSAGSSIGGTSISTIERGVETPWDDTKKFGRIVIRCESETTPYTVWVDDVEVRKITGEAAIANASINSAKIKNLAVDDAKIANLSVGKVTAGRIYADWVQAGRLMTPAGPGGSWSLMDSVGFHVYKDAAGTQKTFDTSNGNTWMSGVLEASEIRGGWLFVPSQYASVPGRTTLNDQGLSVDAAATVNLCPTPSFEQPMTLYPSSGTTAVIHPGAAVPDFAGNVDRVVFTGRSALKVSNTTANGWVDVPCGKAQPNTTYTVSWYSASTRIDDGDPGWNGVSGDFGVMGVIRDDNGARIATGRTGWLLREGQLQGIWAQPLSTGITTIAFPGGFNMRTYLTFTTPASLPANTDLRVRLPAPRTTAGGNESTYAVVYDGLQMEQQPWMTRYCDGDQPNCGWDGTPNNSTSRRQVTRSFWAPTQDEPVFQGSLRAPVVQSRKSKVGSGTMSGTNAIECFIWDQWEMWNSGSGTWWLLTFGDGGNMLGAGAARLSEDDGYFRNGQTSGSFFQAPVSGWYHVSCTITWPGAQITGKLGLRMRFRSKNDADSNAVVRAVEMREVNSTSNTGTNSITLNWAGYLWENTGVFMEGFQTTQTGAATMPPGNSGNQSFSMILIA